MPSCSNGESFDPSREPSPDPNLPSIESSLRVGPTVLENGDVACNYTDVDPNISSLSMVFTTIDGEILSEVPLEKKGTNSFSAIIPAKDLPSVYYRLSKETYDGEKESFVDPAARYLPNGVLPQDSPRAIGQIIDHRKYKIQYKHPVPSQTQSPELKAKKLTDLLVAQIHVGTRTYEGTLSALIEDGIIEKLAERHIDAIKIMPLGAFVGERNWGYDSVTHLFSISQIYGAVDDLKKVINECHKHGIKVIIDLVFNHLSYFIESAEKLYGKDVVSSEGTDWGKGVNFKNKGIRKLYLDCIEYFLEEFNIDGIRFDAAHLLPVDFLEEAIAICKKHNPDTIIIHEGRLEKDHKSLYGKYSNFYSYAHGNMQWYQISLLTPDYRYGYRNNEYGPKHPSNEDKVGFLVWQLDQISKGHDTGLGHDFFGNAAPYERLFLQLFNARQDPVQGLSACRVYLCGFLSTPGLKLIFNGDEDGILSSRFPFFQQHLTEAQNANAAFNRFKEWNEMIVHNPKDLEFLTSHWNGSIDQLKEFYKTGKIDNESFENIAGFIPGEESTFLEAKIRHLDPEISQNWRAFFDSAVRFNETISSREHVFAARNTWGKYEILAYENMELLDSHNPVVGFINIFDYPQQFKLDENGFYNGGKIIFHSNQGVDGVDFATLENGILTIPPLCMVYLDISGK